MDLDRELISLVCADVKVGNFPVQALVRQGVPEPEASRWLAVGKSAQQEGQTPDDSLEVALVAACDVAAADWERGAIAAMTNAKGVEWRKHMALLEKRFPQRYAPKLPQMGNRKSEARSLEDILDEVTKQSAGD